MIRGVSMFRKVISAMAVICLYAAVLNILLGGASGDVSVMSDSAAVKLPVVMYHSILKDTEKSGKYVVTPDTLDSDIKYLHSMGYTTISAAQLIDYVENNEPLPEKPVMLTFDDGCYNNLFYAVPILKDNNARGIFSVVGKYTDDYTESDEVNPNYSYLRWQDVYEMYVSENCEIGNHSYNFHSNDGGRDGAKKRRGESPEEYKRIFAEDAEKFQEECYEHCGFRPVIYTYPYGSYSEESFEILKEMGIKVTLSCEEGINQITHDSECMYLLKRYNRPSFISSEDFFKEMLDRE